MHELHARQLWESDWTLRQGAQPIQVFVSELIAVPQSGQTSHGDGGGVQVSSPVTSTGVPPWISGTVHSKTVCGLPGSAATAGGSWEVLIQWVRWSCQT